MCTEYVIPLGLHVDLEKNIYYISSNVHHDVYTVKTCTVPLRTAVQVVHMCVTRVFFKKYIFFFFYFLLSTYFYRLQLHIQLYVCTRTTHVCVFSKAGYI